MEITTVTRVHNRCVAGVYKYNDGVNHRHLFPLTKVAQYLVDYKSGTFKNFCSFQFVICSVAMDLTQLDNPAKLLKLMQQFGDDADNADKEIDAVISICLESGLESTILDVFKLLIQISIRDETSDQVENHATIYRRQASNGRQKQVTGHACSHVCFSPLNTRAFPTASMYINRLVSRAPETWPRGYSSLL